MTPFGDIYLGTAHSDNPRSLAILGDSADIHTWSNIPHFFFQAASKAGFLTHALNLLEPHYRRHRALWNMMKVLRLQTPGGYQLSGPAIERMWECVPPELRHGEFVSHCQLFPPADRARKSGARHSLFVDTTLRQLYTTPHPGSSPLNSRTLDDAIRREGETYRSAKFFIGMARATVESAVRDYGVDPARAFAVRPGANLDEAMVQAYLDRRGMSWRGRQQPFTRQHPARLGYIGRYYLRKGLPRLVEAAEILAHRGRPVLVSIIGNCPDHLRGHPQIESVGMIDKSTDMARFIETIDSFALGCLPSYAEPLGISTLEALRLGVPVMGTQTGGIPDCIPAHAGFLLPVDVTGEGIADAIEYQLFNPDRYHRLQQGAIDEMSNVTWERTVEKLMAIWRAPSSQLLT